MVEYLLTVSFFVFLYATVWFVYSVVRRRNDVADIAWGLGFIFVAWFSMFFQQNFTIFSYTVCVLVTAWGLRLAVHIFLRNKDKQEDYRYARWREGWGRYFYLKSYLKVFLLQGFLMLLIMSPVLAINYSGEYQSVVFLVSGALIWVVGFFFETVGDYQLNKFIKNPKNKGKLMSSGLWQYTRHPNYFGEVLCWWGLWVVSLATFYGLYAVVGPLVITLLILKVSGIPMLEKKMEQHPDFAAYKKRVSIFIPLPSKNK